MTTSSDEKVIACLMPTARQPIAATWYPGLNQEDTKLCTKYLEEHGKKYSSVFFDWPIGCEYIQINPEIEEPYRSAAIRGSSLRMDMVGVPKEPGPWELVEFREGAGPGAIGSLLTYVTHWPKDLPKNPQLVLVTDFLRPIIKVTADHYKIRTHAYNLVG